MNVTRMPVKVYRVGFMLVCLRTVFGDQLVAISFGLFSGCVLSSFCEALQENRNLAAVICLPECKDQLIQSGLGTP
jgi:hypothetical protein